MTRTKTLLADIAACCLLLGCAQGGGSSDEGRQELLFVIPPVIKYPEELKIRKIDGMVETEITANAQGEVTRVVILSSPDPLLSQAMTDALYKSRLKPRLVNGTPTGFTLKYNGTFTLRQIGPAVTVRHF